MTVLSVCQGAANKAMPTHPEQHSELTQYIHTQKHTNPSGDLSTHTILTLAEAG